MKQQSMIPAISRQKELGKTVVGCFPLYPPVEIFTSMGLLPIVLWNLKGDTPDRVESDKHLQNYACGIARELVQFALSDIHRYLDGLFSYNACDTLRNLPEILAAAYAEAGRTIPMLRMHLPQVNRMQTDSDDYLKNEIEQLIEGIENFYGLPFSPTQFRQTIESYTKMRSMCLHAENLVAEGALSFSALCDVVLSGYFLPVEEQISNLASVVAKAENTPARQGIGVIVSGIMPPPLYVIRAMENAGLCVVANDIASLRRSYGYSPRITDNPGDYYIESFAKRFPCTTLLYRADARVEAFVDLINSSEARGVIFCGEKFCEYEYFEFPFLENLLNKKGIPTLRLEFGIDDTRNIEAYKTRVEAFAELLVHKE